MVTSFRLGNLVSCLLLLLWWLGAPAAAAATAAIAPSQSMEPTQPSHPGPTTEPARPRQYRESGQTSQMESADYTRYELLQPDSASFHILYEVTAISPGATAYFNPIRKGSEASGEAVLDRASGKALRFEVVSGEQARQSGLPDAELDMRYLRIHLPHAVPPEGGVRLLIEKTYQDAKSYYRKGDDRIVFARPLGIRRNAIVLPAGYELVFCNLPAQVLAEPDGRLKVSFMHTGPEAAPLVLEARRLGPAAVPGPRMPAAVAPAKTTGDALAAMTEAAPAPLPSRQPALPPLAAASLSPAASTSPPLPSSPASSVPPSPPPPIAERLAERAHQDRTIVYLLRQPESHAFDLYHDYTETREGTDKYLNVVRKGSAASAPSARNLDTGETLRVETLRGDALRHAGLGAEELREVAGGDGEIAPDTEVVIAHFPPLRRTESVRLRIAETYTDPRSYRLDGGRLVFDRTFGRPCDAVVLPAGWYLIASAIPAIVSETADGRIRLDFVNPRPDEIAVLIEAARRPPG